MSFKLEKLKLDLELDLTSYIPGENGTINPLPMKTTPEELFNWMKFCTANSNDQEKTTNDNDLTDTEKLVIARENLIKQIDYLYNKGESYWKAIPFPLLTKIITYIRDNVKDTEKK